MRPDPASRRAQVLFGLLLVGATLAAYAPAIRAGYIWDDKLHLLDNPVLKPGGLAQAWVPGTYINYWPLTFSAYWLQDKLWGVAHPAGFHLVNILLHALSALLVWRVLRLVLHIRATASTEWASLLGAAIFALHPVNVESVAWIAQLKNVLALLLALASLWFYLRHDGSGRRLFYALAVAAFALSTLAKGIGLTLPVVLVALAWWHRGRIGWGDVRRVAPFLVIAVLMTSVEVAMQHDGEPWEVPRSDSVLSRLAGAGWCVWFYLSKLIWPFNLSFVYPRWTIDGGKLWSFLPDAMLLLVMLIAWLQRARWGRGPFMVLFSYAVLLLPVLGFTNIYFMRYSLVADHWQYAAMIVPAAGLAAGLVAAARTKTAAIVVAAAAVSMIVSLGVLTHAQTAIYKDEETLWQAVLQQNPDAWMAHNNLGNWLADRGRVQEALAHYQATVRLRSEHFQAHNNVGVILGRLGRPEEAIASYERALAIDGTYVRARENLIAAYKEFGSQILGRGKFLNAEDDYKTAQRYFVRLVELAPDDAEAHYGLGVALIEVGEVSKGVDQLQEATRVSAGFLPAYDLLAQLLATRAPVDGGDPDRAIQAALRACALTRDQDPVRLDRLAVAYASAGRFKEAIATEERALEIVQRYDPQNVAGTLRAHRDLFRAGKAVRGPSPR